MDTEEVQGKQIDKRRIYPLLVSSRVISKLLPSSVTEVWNSQEGKAVHIPVGKPLKCGHALLFSTLRNSALSSPRPASVRSNSPPRGQ